MVENAGCKPNLRASPLYPVDRSEKHEQAGVVRESRRIIHRDKFF
jgi:hypothetical protein